MDKRERAEFYKELEVLEKNGIHMIIDDLEVSAFQVVQAHMIKESGTYMRDYILDDEGHVAALKFDKIE